MLKYILLFLLAGIYPNLSVAQDTHGMRLITVTGEGELKVVPNEALLNMSVETEAVTPADAKTKNDKIAAAALRIAKDNGIPAKDIQTSYTTLQPRYEYKNGTRISVGYQMRKTINITLRDINKLDQLITQETSAGVNFINQTQFENTDLKSNKEKARSLAVQDAKDKAEALAKDLGVHLGKPFSIIEQPASFPVRPMNNMGVNMDPNQAKTSNNTVALGEIVIRDNVTVQFELQ